METAATSSTNLDINSIVNQLMTVERQPINKLNVTEASFQTKLSAYGSIKGAVASFQTAMQNLGSAIKFTKLDAIPSDDTILSATASSIAVAGTYSLEVTSLAQSQKLVAAGQSSSTAAIGDGTPTTITFDFGTINGGTLDSITKKYTGVTSFGSNGNGTKSITIDSSNNSLQGIRDAINAAKIGVTATIINDGSASPYRLALSSDNNGVSNSLKISVNGDASVTNLLAHDPAATQNLSENVTATNANFKVNGVSVSKTSNSATDVIQGVTLNLKKITTTSTTVTVAHDNASVSNSVAGFVKAYNDLAKTLKDISAYNPATKQAAILQGDSTVRSLQSQLRNALGSPVVGASGALTTLSQIGISFQKDGSLGLDNTKLNNAITNNVSDIASLFATVGKGTDSLITFNSATSNTKAGSYAVNVTQIATQGNTVGNSAANTTITDTNKELDVTVNGVSASITLNAGVYTAQTLAAELQAKINGASSFSNAGITVAVTQNSGVLSVTSSSYGSKSSVTIGGAGVVDLLGATPTQTAGVDVAGSIGGGTSTGSGQVLSNAQGLNITINGGALGDRGSVNYSNGYAFSLDIWTSTVLTTDGALASRTGGINNSIKDLGNRRAAIETRLVGIERRYRAQFSALDGMLSSMNQTSNYLTQQLAQLAKL
ncbi:MAG: flagellar filament capping protein FliD [Candidatus Nitrotoga sp.]|nr:flagellar filament capping protein FliD [Candidatus Nitrotoga sp.]MDO9448709.1 flagellar filament capping protein FliD [Candidatus Nitrotoga sp.]MDP3498629.1 flagellar filament capping protein FliD [Candidatus Nitrotoga sp.]